MKPKKTTQQRAAQRSTPTKVSAKSMRGKLIKMFLLMGILFGGIFGYKTMRLLLSSHPIPPPVTVSTTVIKTEEWQSQLNAVGTLVTVNGVDVTSEVAGIIKKIHFVPGATVQEGDLLVELNADAEKAELNSLKAAASLAEITYKRNEAQYAIRAISKETLDTNKADLDTKVAQVEQQEAVIAKKVIRAPFAGSLGIKYVSLGQYLNPGDKIITLQALDPIRVDFALPQQTVSSLKVGQNISLKVDAYPTQTFNGIITTIEPKVDTATRNVQVEATIDNPESKLFYGMYGKVEVFTGETQKVVVIPKVAISFNPFGEIVYVIQEKGTDKSGKPVLMAQQAFVTVGESRNEQTVILKGLKEGDQVVTAGQLKLKNGTVVRVNNTIVPKEQASTPSPEN